MFPRPATPGSEIEGAGGAYVRRRFTFGESVKISGDVLTAEEVESIPLQNLHSLINTNIIELFPKAPTVVVAGKELKRYVVRDGNTNRYNVVEGVLVTEDTMTLAQANALVAKI